MGQTEVAAGAEHLLLGVAGHRRQPHHLGLVLTRLGDGDDVLARDAQIAQ